MKPIICITLILALAGCQTSVTPSVPVAPIALAIPPMPNTVKAMAIIAPPADATGTNYTNTLTLGWNDTNAGVAGFYVLYGTNSHQYGFTNSVATNQLAFTLPGSMSGYWYFEVEGFDTNGNVSLPSREERYPEWPWNMVAIRWTNTPLVTLCSNISNVWTSNIFYTNICRLQITNGLEWFWAVDQFSNAVKLNIKGYYDARYSTN